MAVKWVSALASATSLGAFAAVNLVAGADIPLWVGLALVAAFATSAVVVVMLEIYHRLDSRVNEVSDRLTSRFDEITARLDEPDVPVMDQAIPGAPLRGEGAVIPFAPRRTGRRCPWHRGVTTGAVPPLRAMTAQDTSNDDQSSRS